MHLQKINEKTTAKVRLVKKKKQVILFIVDEKTHF